MEGGTGSDCGGTPVAGDLQPAAEGCVRTSDPDADGARGFSPGSRCHAIAPGSRDTFRRAYSGGERGSGSFGGRAIHRVIPDFARAISRERRDEGAVWRPADATV